MNPTILLADDHILISKALRKVIEIEFGYRDIDSVTSCSAVLKFLQRSRYTHLVIDIGLSDGSSLDILPAIRDLYPQTMIMVYTAKPFCIYGRILQKAGICHYLSKQADEPETIDYLGYFLGELPERQPVTEVLDSPFSSLTGRQLEVLRHLLDGRSGMEIAAALQVNSSTISILKNQLFQRTGARNMIELTTLAGLYCLTR